MGLLYGMRILDKCDTHINRVLYEGDLCIKWHLSVNERFG